MRPLSFVVSPEHDIPTAVVYLKFHYMLFALLHSSMQCAESLLASRDVWKIYGVLYILKIVWTLEKVHLKRELRGSGGNSYCSALFPALSGTEKCDAPYESTSR